MSGSAPVVVVAGLPGAGKSTLIGRAVDRRHWTVLDTDDLRERGSWLLRRRSALYAWHYLTIVAAIGLRRRPVVIHSRGTRERPRRFIAALARLRRRPAVLLLLHAPRALAEAGQHERGRVLDPGEMDAEAERWEGVLRAAADGSLQQEGWGLIVDLDRAQAARVHAGGPAGFALVTQRRAPAGDGHGPLSGRPAGAILHDPSRGGAAR